jgi:hypothetical protein
VGFGFDKVGDGRSWWRSGFLRYAPHDGAVSCSGRNDDFVGWFERTGNGKSNGRSAVGGILLPSQQVGYKHHMEDRPSGTVTAVWITYIG